MHVTLLDTKTGERRKSSDYFNVYWWSIGNGSCDCNRRVAFDHDDPDEDNGYCCGCERYLIVDASGDLEGLTLEEFIRKANQDYPPELIAAIKG
jgi:hypothetical protein